MQTSSLRIFEVFFKQFLQIHLKINDSNHLCSEIGKAPILLINESKFTGTCTFKFHYIEQTKSIRIDPK
jgi:hypothetical protein